MAGGTAVGSAGAGRCMPGQAACDLGQLLLRSWVTPCQLAEAVSYSFSAWPWLHSADKGSNASIYSRGRHVSHVSRGQHRGNAAAMRLRHGGSEIGLNSGCSAARRMGRGMGG
ncbi:hypothetical protein HaLaN_29692 [Haematococcus lacustris]|uniref:Uncharacterized protein n=1 Tax=Haematococcus lacustris TaxID=44745 RepID=A0A6A0AFD7_HAELA|nr:hypothetical protein HaLaN_29692 [Haematococcus lacustris]